MQTELEQAHATLATAEASYHAAPSDKSWKAVEAARAVIAQIETRQRVDADIAAKKAADDRAAARAAKKARLDELHARLATQNERTEALGERIAAAILTAKELVLVEEVALVDESNALANEANELREALGDERRVPSPLMPHCCQITSSQACQRAMPDGVMPWHLSFYAGKFWF